MGAPKVTIGRLDLTTRVPRFPGVSIGGVAPLLKGPVDKAFLVTTETEFLKKATPDETVAVGMDLAHYDILHALQGTDRFWVARAVNGALSGGIVISSHAPAWDGSTAYAAGARVIPSSPNGYVYEATAAGVSSGSEPAFPTSIGATVVNGGVTWKCVSRRAGNFAIPIGYEDIATEYDFGASAAAWLASASYAVGDKVVPITPNGFYYHATDGGQVDSVQPVWPTIIGATVTDGGVVWTCEGTLADDALLVHQCNPGVWGRQVGIKSFNFAASPSVVKIADAFYIQVFNRSTQVEPGSGKNGFLCSRIGGKKDGFGQNIFVEDRLKGSNFINAISNTAVAATVQPAQIPTLLRMTGGSDGQAVTDTHMIRAAALLENPAQFPLTLLIDSGWATPAFGVELDRIATARGDCESFLSVPLAAEEDADYIAAITAYRATTLNLNSFRSWLYTPHVKVQDKYNDRPLWVPVTGLMAAIVSKTAAAFDLWLPPAGFDDRTKLPVVDVRQRFTEGEMDTLSDNQINSIIFEPGSGIIPFEQKTLLSTPSALQEGNVALLLLVIEPAVKVAMKSFIFKVNTPSTRAVAKARIDSFLEGIKNSPIPGLSAYRTVISDENNSDDDTAAGIMNVQVFLTPTRAIREIPVTIILTNPGAELSLAA